MSTRAQAELFWGPESLRMRGEGWRLAIGLLSMPITLSIIGSFVHDRFTIHTIAVLIVGGMLLVSLGRGRLLGSAVRVHENQFGHVFEIVADCARRLQMPAPAIFLRNDPFVPLNGMGLGDPYQLVISSYWVELFSDDELRFLVGRELAHMKAGHTRMTSLLSVNGREHPIVAGVFGAWLRTIDFTADRVGLLMCGSIDVALSAIAVSTFNSVGRRIDMQSFAEQRREIDAEPLMRMGERLGSTPFATNRIAKLHAFANDPLYRVWTQRLNDPVQIAPPVPVGRRIFAGPVRRALTVFFDIVLIAALLPGSNTGDENSPDKFSPTITIKDASGKTHTKKATELSDADVAAIDKSEAPGPVRTILHALARSAVATRILSFGTVAPAYFLYAAIFVGLLGQTFGMMILDVRIVDVRLRRIGILRAFGRYALLAAQIFSVVGWVFLLRRVQPFESWSGTRTVNGNARPVMLKPASP